MAANSVEEVRVLKRGGGGTGENSPQPVTGTNPLPNANGQ
jgi:hypothetical protein